MVGRFAKMSVLWGTYFYLKEGADDALAAALGYAMATIFAILKGKAFPKKTPKKKKTKGKYVPPPSKESLFDPPQNEIFAGRWQQYKSPAIPITGYLFYYRIRENDIDEVHIWLGKDIPATSKYIAQIETKFGGREHYNRHVAYAKKLIEEAGDSFLSKWYDIWKGVRDLDWEAQDGQDKLFKSA